MADEESKLQTEILKKQASDINEQNATIKDLLKQARQTGVDAKEQLKLVKTQQQLEKSQATLAKDLGKNISDLKGGLVSQVEGFTAGILGPFGGIANSLTTGFFKRKKQNDENIAQNQALIEQAKEQAKKLGGLVEKATVTDEKLEDLMMATSDVAKEMKSLGKTEKSSSEDSSEIVEDAVVESGGEVSKKIDLSNQYLKVIAGGVPTAEELEEAKRNGGAVDVPEPTEEEKGGFGIMLLKFLGLVLAAASGLAAGAAIGIVKYLTDIVRMIGKPIIKLLDAIPINSGTIGKFFTKINNFFGGEFSPFTRIGKFLNTSIDVLKNFTGGVFTKINNFFGGELSPFKKIGSIVDSVIDTVKGFTGNIFNRIKSVFTSLGDVGRSLAAPFKAIMDFFPGGKGEGGIIGKVLGFLNPFKSVFSAFARLGAKLVAPLNIIIGIFDAGFETKEAVEKSNGFFASLFNGITGAIGGFIDGAVMSLLDLIKDGVSFVAGLLGFEEVEKKLDEFSFSKVFNEMLDKIYNFFNELFNFDLTAMANSLIPEDSFLRKFVPESLFASSEKAVVKGERHQGGPIKEDGLYNLNAGEMVMDNKAAALMGTVLNAQMMERGGLQMGGGANAPVVMDNSTQVVNNNTTIRQTNPIGQMLPNEVSNFVSKMAA